MKYKVEINISFIRRLWFSYYKPGHIHRLDGPAVEWGNGYKSWFKHGIKHRIDGPAVIWSDGSKEYYIENVRYTQKEFDEIQSKN